MVFGWVLEGSGGSRRLAERSSENEGELKRSAHHCCSGGRRRPLPECGSHVTRQRAQHSRRGQSSRRATPSSPPATPASSPRSTATAAASRASSTWSPNSAGAASASPRSTRTSTPPPRRGLIFHVFAALAEFIRELIVIGTDEGLAAARDLCPTPAAPSPRSPSSSASPRALSTTTSPTYANCAPEPSPAGSKRPRSRRTAARSISAALSVPHLLTPDLPQGRPGRPVIRQP
jgi:hypothetical protein